MEIYAVADLHGCLEGYKRIKKYIKPEDVVYCLGDCGDRGPEPWETIKAVLNDPQFIYLKGNHEDMLVKAADEILKFGYNPRSYYQRLLAINGGAETLEQLLGESQPENYVKRLNNLPLYAALKNPNNLLLCHAGCTYKGLDKLENQDLLWDREHFHSKRLSADNVIVIHGHTPIPYLAERLDAPYGGTGAFHYAPDKYCIDAGTVVSGKVILFNLTTFKSKVFKI